MWGDPIVAEVHRLREEIAARSSYDVDAMFAEIRTRQAALGSRLVSPKKRAAQIPAADQEGQPTSPASAGLTPKGVC
jgi:hypothetical protein